MTTRIKLRRDTATNWTSANPVLALGEAGYDSTNNQIRVGNGTSTWSLLHPIGGGTADGVASLTLTGSIPYTNGDILDEPILFTRPNNSENTVDAIDTGLTLKRKNNNGGIYNSANDTETAWSNNQSPLGTEWNTDGWGDLTDVQTRVYTTFYNACEGAIGENVVHKEFVMHDTINDKYYKVDFNWWQPNNGGGNNLGLDNRSGFSYTRTLINTTKVTYFVRPSTDSTVVDEIEPGLTIKRDSAGGIYNVDVDAEWDPDVSPSGTLWNDEGWNDFTDITTRVWKPLYAAVHGQLGNHLVNRELIMWDTIHDRYYIVKFTEWGQNNGGSFAYYRREIDPVATKIGIIFADGTVQTTAFETGDIKIRNNEILLTNQDLDIRTTADPLVDADIGIYAADDLWLRAQGDLAELGAGNAVRIISGDQELINYYTGNPIWNGSTVAITDYNSDTERSLQLYLNSTFDIWFRTDIGKWYKTSSSGNATYDGDTTTYTIPVNVNNPGDPISITEVLLRDPDWDGNTEWLFDRQGLLRTPNLNVPQQNGTFNAPTLQLGDTNSDLMITNAFSTDNQRGNGYGIYIQGARGYGNWSTTGTVGKGTEIYIIGGAGGEGQSGGEGGEGGNVHLRGGVGQNGGHGGHIRITAGDSQWQDSVNTVQSGNVYITAGNATTSNGVPDGQGIAGSIYLTTGVTESAGTQGAIQFSTFTSNGGTENIWKFNSNGTTKFPTLTVPISDNANPNGTGQTLKFSDSTQQAIIYGPSSTSELPSADRIIIQGAPGFTGTDGEGGDVYLWAGPGGSTNGNGGDIKVRAGYGIGTGGGGYLNFQAGDSQTGYGGYINIESGESATSGQGGNIDLLARSGGSIFLTTSQTGVITLTAGANALTLTTDGKTTFPGAVVKSTVAKTGAVIEDLGFGRAATVTPSPSNNTNLNVGTVNGVVMGAGFTLDITVAGNGDISAVVTASDQNQSVNDTSTLIGGGALGGTSGVDDVVFTVATLTDIIIPTPIDLTKSINKLTTGAYTLADGVEGQIMYLVTQDGVTDHNNIIVEVSNMRITGVVNTNYYLVPLRQIINSFAFSTQICTLIFTDGAWSQIGG